MIAQLVMMDRGGKFDWPRLGRAWVFGTFILGPLAHFHFNFLDWLVVKRVGSFYSISFLCFFNLNYSILR